jgi:hypothetical protein
MTQQSSNHPNKNTTPDDLYAAVVANVLAKVSGPGVSEVTAKELADGIASECVAECGRMGLFDRSQPTRHVELAVKPEGSGAAKPEVSGNGFGAPKFVESTTPGLGVMPTTPAGAPGSPALHYNHSAVQPQPYPQVGPGPLPPTQGAPPSQVIGALQPVSQSPTVHPSYVTAPNGGSQPQVAQESRVVFQPDVVESDVPWYPPHLAYMHKKPVPPPQVQASQPVQVPQVPGTPQPAQTVPGMGTSAVAAPPEVGGQKIVNATGDAYMPPAPAGVMNTVVHLPTPQGHSALGLSGVISQPEVKSSQYERVVAPQNERVITPVGTGGTQFVPENIVK